MRASVDQRLALLSGLLDTDGCVEKKGRRIFVSVCERLALDVREIVHSLGMNASLRLVERRVDGIERPIWRVHIHGGGFELFGMERKRAREVLGWRKQKHMRIAEIREAGFDDCTCIRVDSPEGMFLAGPEYIPTHNTYPGGAEMAMQLTGEYPDTCAGCASTTPYSAGLRGSPQKRPATIRSACCSASRECSAPA